MSEISAGSAAIIVKDKSLKELRSEAPFMKWLNENGFKGWKHGKGWFDSVDWVYVNINSKVYALGMPGINVCQHLGEHAITVEEFMAIFNIFESYKGSSVLVMEKARKE